MLNASEPEDAAAWIVAAILSEWRVPGKVLEAGRRYASESALHAISEAEARVRMGYTLTAAGYRTRSLATQRARNPPGDRQSAKEGTPRKVPSFDSPTFFVPAQPELTARVGRGRAPEALLRGRVGPGASPGRPQPVQANLRRSSRTRRTRFHWAGQLLCLLPGAHPATG